MIKNIAVIGTGGVGGFFGGKLFPQAKADESRHLTFLARGPHLREMKEQGLMAEIFNLSQALSVFLPVGTPDELFRKGDPLSHYRADLCPIGRTETSFIKGGRQGQKTE